jgi:hypothetical protein
MRPPGAAEILTLWEQGMDLPLLRKILLLLELAYPEMEPEEIAKLSIGVRDARLFHLREWMFGSSFSNTIGCPKCTKQMEWEMRMEDLNMLSQYSGETMGEYNMESGNYSIRFRLPNSLDISEVLPANASQSGSETLLQKCILEIKQKSGRQQVRKLPVKLMNDLSAMMEELDPVADIRMNITCPNCAFLWEARFDIMSYLWEEIENWAQRILRDVVLLAKNFGWSEKEILNLDAARRQRYVEMITV